MHRFTIAPSTLPVWLGDANWPEVVAVANQLQPGQVVLALQRAAKPKVVAAAFDDLPELVRREIERLGLKLGPWPERVLVTCNEGKPVVITEHELVADTDVGAS